MFASLFLKRAKKEIPNLNIWCYTGYLFEDILSGKVGEKQTAVDMLNHIDILVDGRFEKSLFDAKLHWKGSANQRVIDVKETLRQHQIVLWCE